MTINLSFTYTHSLFNSFTSSFRELSSKQRLAAVVAAVAASVLTIFTVYRLYQNLSNRIIEARKIKTETEQKTREAAGQFFPIKGQYDPAYLDFSHECLWDQWDAIRPALRSKEAWKNPALIEKFSLLMEKAGEEINLIYHQLDELTEGHPQKAEEMAAILADQGSRGYNFCYKYFQCSVTQLYHLARGYAYVDENDYYQIPQALTDDEKALFYKAGTPQNRWREIYNHFCSQLDAYQMKEEVRKADQRFVNWAKPDLSSDVRFSVFPDTTPT